MEKLEIKLLHNDAKIPVRANIYDSGLDLYAVEDIELNPCRKSLRQVLQRIGRALRKKKDDNTTQTCVFEGSRALVPTGIAINLPIGYEAQVRPKSGITAKTDLRVQFGTVDFGYNSEIKVMVDNIGSTKQKIEKGKKIAQLVIAPVVYPEPVVVDKFENHSDRGGFGSTGLD